MIPAHLAKPRCGGRAKDADRHAEPADERNRNQQFDDPRPPRSKGMVGQHRQPDAGARARECAARPQDTGYCGPQQHGQHTFCKAQAAKNRGGKDKGRKSAQASGNDEEYTPAAALRMFRDQLGRIAMVGRFFGMGIHQRPPVAQEIRALSNQILAGAPVRRTGDRSTRKAR